MQAFDIFDEFVGHIVASGRGRDVYEDGGETLILRDAIGLALDLVADLLVEIGTTLLQGVEFFGGGAGRADVGAVQGVKLPVQVGLGGLVVRDRALGVGLELRLVLLVNLPRSWPARPAGRLAGSGGGPRLRICWLTSFRRSSILARVCAPIEPVCAAIAALVSLLSCSW